MAVHFKLFSLAMRTVSKPLVKSFKSYAVNNKAFKHGCVGIGQFLNRVEQVPSRRLGIRGAPKVIPLSEERALESGANSLSEFLLFSIAAIFVLWENARSARKEKHHEMDQEERIKALEDQLEKLIIQHK